MTIYRKNPEIKDVMTIQETALYMSCAFKTVKQLMNNGEIPYRKIGQRYFIAKEAVDAWLKGESAK